MSDLDKIALWVGLISGILALFTFFFGISNFKELFKSRTRQKSEPAPPPPPIETTENIDISRLPRPSAELVGRETELAQLTEALTTPRYLVHIQASGGVGKSALTFRWLQNIQPDYHGASKVFAWSFYSQGSHDTQNSSLPFFEQALPFFGYRGELPKDDTEKGRMLAKYLRTQSFILILDGLEPLQQPAHILDGELKDIALRALLDDIEYHGLNASPSLIVVSSRQPLTELNSWDQKHHQVIDLQVLSDANGAKLLQKLGVTGTTEELETTTREIGGHALALVLLGKMLVAQFNGEVARRDQLPVTNTALEALNSQQALSEADKKLYRHVHRILTWYADFYSENNTSEAFFLDLLSLFDRPMGLAEKNILVKKADCAAPLRELSDTDWQQMEKTLENAGLLLRTEGMRTEWDCHPLIRSYFAQQFQATRLDQFRQAHLVLFEYYQKVPEKQQPDTLAELKPLYRAVVHGCLAGKYQEAKNIHLCRILRGNEVHYSWHSLGLYSFELSTLLSFFPQGWRNSAQNGLPAGEQAWLLMEVSFCLSSLGRIQESIEPNKQAIKLYTKVENWEKSAICARNLVDSMLSTGELKSAYEVSEQSLKYAEQNGDWFEKLRAHVAIASVLYFQGMLDLATEHFIEAENLQKKNQPEHPQLVSLSGYWYCSLLLEQSTNKTQLNEILKRGAYSLKVSTDKKWIHITALDSLILARTYHKLNESEKAKNYFEQAVIDIKKASRRNFECFFYIDRANFYLDQQQFAEALRDLAEAEQIIRRSDMKLYAVDYHLAMRRAEPNRAQFHENEAKKLITATGYHLRKV